MRLYEFVKLDESEHHFYDEYEFSELIGWTAGSDSSEEWIDFLSCSIPNLTDDKVRRDSIVWANEWLSKHGIPITILNMTQEWDDNDNSTYKFEVIGDDPKNIH